MKEKIFNKMEEYGWNLDNYDEVYNIHYDFIKGLFDYLSKEDKKIDLNEIDEEKLFSMTTFVGDFMRAINDLNNEQSKGDE